MALGFGERKGQRQCNEAKYLILLRHADKPVMRRIGAPHLARPAQQLADPYIALLSSDAAELADGGIEPPTCCTDPRLGAVIFTDITGELAEAVITDRYYPGVSAVGTTLVWGAWRKPSHAELVEIWPSRRAPDTPELARGWWQATLEEAGLGRAGPSIIWVTPRKW
jgi:hypothetical protein